MGGIVGGKERMRDTKNKGVNEGTREGTKKYGRM